VHGRPSSGTNKTIPNIVFTWTSIGLRCKGLSRQRTKRHSRPTTLADLRWLLRHAWFLCIGCRWPTPTRGMSNLTQLVTQHNSSHFPARLPSCAGAILATGERLRRNPLKDVEFLALAGRPVESAKRRQRGLLRRDEARSAVAAGRARMVPHPSIHCAAAAATSCNVDGADGV
jgi:hypothetical protein